MSVKKDQSTENENRENPKEPRVIPGDPYGPGSGSREISEMYGDIRKGQKPRKLDD